MGREEKEGYIGEDTVPFSCHRSCIDIFYSGIVMSYKALVILTPHLHAIK